jgi:hypothetical protein
LHGRHTLQIRQIRQHQLAKMGSSTSYGKRYTACMLLNIVTQEEDDDGTSAEASFIGVDTQAEINKLIDATGRL